MTTTDLAPAPTPLDPDAVAERLLGVVNDGGIAILGSIGHSTGLFETLGSLPPATSQQIADAAGLDERYVREWLGGVVTAGLVAYDPATRTYWLDESHRPFVTGAGVDNLIRLTRLITMMGQVVPQIIEKFHTGAGSPTTTTRASTTPWPRRAPWSTTPPCST